MPQGAPESFVLENVPYIGDDWQNRLDGPQDLMFPSAMGSLTKYLGGDPLLTYRPHLCISGMAYRQVWHPTEWNCAFDQVWEIAPDPIEPIRRCFEAIGYAFTLVGNEELCRTRPRLQGVFAEYAAPDVLKQRVCESLRAGRPVILLGDTSIVAGYEESGDVLVGWKMVDPGAETDDHGYVRLRDWTDRTEAALFVGDKTGPLPLLDACRKAVLWGVEGSRMPRQGEFAAGRAALAAWSDALLRDGDLSADDLTVLRDRHGAHFFISLAVAEGRAFGNAAFWPLAEAYPETNEEFQAVVHCYGIMHDLVWRLWQSEGPGGDEEKLQRFTTPELRRELSRIVGIQRDQDALAVAHLERALLATDVPPDQIMPASEEEKAIVARLEAREQSCGGDPSMLAREVVDQWVNAVPDLSWGTNRDCTFIGALSAAMAPTMAPYSYADLMGYSGLAFRTRWFDNPQGRETPFGTMRWHPVSPHGEQAEEIAAISKATGWQLRVEDVPNDPADVNRQRLITDVVLSVNEGLPVVVGRNTDLATIYGYHIHSMNLFLRDYQHPGQERLRVPDNDPGLHSPMVFLAGLGDVPPVRESLLGALTVAVRNGHREQSEGFRYGLDALNAWRDALAGYDAYTDDERNLLFLANWWSLMHLADARRAAVEFLELCAGVLQGESANDLTTAQGLYEQEAAALQQFLGDHQRFVGWWGGGAGVADWDTEARQAEQDLLSRACDLETQALTALEAIVAREPAR